MKINCNCGKTVKFKKGDRSKRCGCGNIHYPVFQYDKLGNTTGLLKAYTWGAKNAY